jgi:hypothetical protein
MDYHLPMDCAHLVNAILQKILIVCPAPIAKIIDMISSIADGQHMVKLADILPKVNQLSDEDQAGLAAHLLAKLRGAPLGPDDAELTRRDAEIDAGTAELITFDELRKAVGR